MGLAGHLPLRSGSRIAAGSLFLSALALGSALAFTASANASPTSVPLGTASSYAILAGSTITNTGASVIHGNLGLSPGTSVTGFPPGTVSGTQNVTNGAAGQAQTDLTTAYNNAAGQGPTSPIASDLGGKTLTPGVYNSASSIGLTGTLTLNGGGDPNAVFVFQAGSTLTTASSSRISLINGAQSCNVFWQVGSSATLGTGSNFTGTVLALQSITVTTGVTIDGRMLARNAAVTLDTDTITTPTCTTSGTTTTTKPSSTTTTTKPSSTTTTTKPSSTTTTKSSSTTTTTTVPNATKSPVTPTPVRVTG